MRELTNKSYKNYDKLSRYLLFPYFYNNNDNKYVYGTVAWLDLSTPYQSYVVVKNDTLDSISLRAYGSPLYYWILASFNRIIDVLSPLKEGTIIKIPVKSVILFEENSR